MSKNLRYLLMVIALFFILDLVRMGVERFTPTPEAPGTTGECTGSPCGTPEGPSGGPSPKGPVPKEGDDND